MMRENRPTRRKGRLTSSTGLCLGQMVGWPEMERQWFTILVQTAQIFTIAQPTISMGHRYLRESGKYNRKRRKSSRGLKPNKIRQAKASKGNINSRREETLTEIKWGWGQGFSTTSFRARHSFWDLVQKLDMVHSKETLNASETLLEEIELWTKINSYETFLDHSALETCSNRMSFLPLETFSTLTLTISLLIFRRISDLPEVSMGTFYQG